MSTIGTSLFLFFESFHHKMFVSTYSTVMTVIPWFSSVRFSRRHRRARSYARKRERQPSKVWSKMRITLRGLINDCEMKNRQKFFIAVTFCSATPTILCFWHDRKKQTDMENTSSDRRKNNLSRNSNSGFLGRWKKNIEKEETKNLHRSQPPAVVVIL